MLTPAEELLAAVKEHATADVAFSFDDRCVWLHVEGVGNVEFKGCVWWESHNQHPTASSAVQSAFARARGGKA